MDLCVAPAALQLEAGRAVLEAILHVEQVRGMGGLAGAVVVDGEERVILADGTVRDIGEWRGADPFGRPLRELPPAPLRDSVSVPARGGDGAARVLLVPSPLPEATATPWPLRLAARVHAAADALRGALATGGAGRQAPSTAEWTPAETVREARGLAWAFADQAIAAGTMVGVDLAEVANAVLADQAEGLSYGRVRVFSFIAPAACPLPADLLTVRSVIHALMARARASLAPGGGTLTVRTWLEEDWACAAVSDDAGASRAREAQGPQPVSEAPGAEGDRDLREAADAVESLGGRFDVERRPGVWNRCTLMLPRDPSKVVKPRRTETKARRAPDGGLSVLVVDDNPALRSVLRRYLERRGHRITEAADGDDALRVLARGERYDRLIVDVQMPGRSGPELFGSLETVAPDLRHRTLFMTGDLMEAATERFLAESGRPAIAKPFDLAEIARRVEGAA
jgi:CheY-like chemotaxis protein